MPMSMSEMADEIQMTDSVDRLNRLAVIAGENGTYPELESAFQLRAAELRGSGVKRDPLAVIQYKAQLMVKLGRQVIAACQAELRRRKRL